ncbi:MAG: hypothetical protein B1H08_00785 [Candidatus Omnitrophica bacterium 4484_171]|nr:MAG: hypothetical protein B1H08_00785 [Candidatus Omnitrophica bacterium 4484_171]
MNEEDIIINLKARNKKNAISVMLNCLVNTKRIGKNDKRLILKVIMQREDMGSTAIGGNIALPHARLDCVKDIVSCIAISREGIDFDSLDEEPVHIIVLLLSNQKEAGLHLKTLAYLAKMLRDKSFVRKLEAAKEKSEVISLIARQSNV